MATDREADRRRRRPLRAVAALGLDDEQHRELRSVGLQHQQPGGHQPGERADRQRPALQRHRPPRRRLPVVREQPRGLQRPGGERRCSTVRRAGLRRRTRTCSSRASACRTRSTEDDRPLERGRVPQPRHAERLAAARRQSAVPAAGQRQQRHHRQPRRRRRRGRPAVRDDRDRQGVQGPDRVHLLGGHPARTALELHR